MAADELLNLFVTHEGLRLHPYDDSTGRPATPSEPLRGKLTIGVGRNLTDVGISRQEAMTLLRNDIKIATKKAQKYRFFDGMSRVRQAVVISMIFNIGSIDGFVRFRAALAVKDWRTAATEMLENSPGNPTKWARQVGDRATQLAAMMQTGDWPT